MLFPPEEIRLAGLVENPAADGAKILLVGWEGTLAPIDAGPQATPLPAEAIALVEPLVLGAMDSVQAAVTGLASPCATDARALENLAKTLERRLGSLYALPVAFGRMHHRWPEREGADRIARMLAQDWVVGVELFLARLKADSERIARWMEVPTLPLVVSFRAAASDIHGRAGGVIEIEFVGGGRIFYKPRPVTGELLWAELNAAVATVDRGASVMAARALAGGRGDGSGYGWMEALATGSCDAEEHWHRSGALLCLAQHAGMSDLHMANVMATAQGPAVLDAECLADPSGSHTAGDHDAALLATGLLPDASMRGAEPLPDVSGLFGKGVEVSGVLLPRWSTSPGGHAAVSFGPGRLLEQGNCHASRRAPLACLPRMLEGYLRCARALLSLRHDLLGRGGWVDRLDQLHCPRVVLRDTLSYGSLISRSLVSGVIGSEESRRAELQRMLLETPCALQIRENAELLDAEVDALLRLCVPRLHVPSETREVASDEGRVLAREAVPCTPALGVQRRLEAMCLGNFEHDATSSLSAILFRARAAEGAESG